jgi:branched-chain amino acid transport system permease protein
VFASDVNDGIVSYKSLSNAMAALLPGGWAVQNIALDDLSVSTARTQLLAAMNGGITRPIGPFIGALIFVLLRTFTLDFLVAIGLDGNRFRLLIGLGFLVIVLFSPDGVVGLWERWRNRGQSGQRPPGGDRHG